MGFPLTIGGGISTSDSVSLAEMPIAGLPIGTRVWNLDVGSFFKLTASVQTVITIDPTDGYDDPQWTFANATFTGHEGDSLVVGLQGPDRAFSGSYVIDTVDSVHVVTVVDPVSGATIGPLSGSVVLFADALETDVVVAAKDAFGVRWVIDDTIANATHADTADVADLADEATAPANADTFGLSLGLAWPEYVSRRVLALDSTLTRMAPSSDCVNIGIDMTFGSATGTGAANALTSIPGGGIELTSGGTAGGIRVAALGNGSVSRGVQNCRTQHYGIYCRAKIVTAPASGASRLLICVVNDGTNDVGIGVNFAASATKWCLLNTSIGTAGVDTGVAFDANWHDLFMRVDGTNIKLYVDWVQIGVNYTAATYLDAQPGFPRTYAYNAAVNQTVNHYMNRWALFMGQP